MRWQAEIEIATSAREKGFSVEPATTPNQKDRLFNITSSSLVASFAAIIFPRLNKKPLVYVSDAACRDIGCMSFTHKYVHKSMFVLCHLHKYINLCVSETLSDLPSISNQNSNTFISHFNRANNFHPTSALFPSSFPSLSHSMI